MAPIKSDEIIKSLKSLANPSNVAGMVRYGISPAGTLGVSMPALRAMAKDMGLSHGLAEDLWGSGIHEARILAALIDDPKQVTVDQMDRWVLDVDSWDICDQLCNNLFRKTPFAYEKAAAWSGHSETFVKRAGFVLVACLAVHDKDAGNEAFAAFLPVIVRQANDERNFVKKSVNWALRQIGKRNQELNRLALATAREIGMGDTKSARWIAADTIRELTSEKSQYRWHRKSSGTP